MFIVFCKCYKVILGRRKITRDCKYSSTLAAQVAALSLACKYYLAAAGVKLWLGVVVAEKLEISNWHGVSQTRANPYVLFFFFSLFLIPVGIWFDDTFLNDCRISLFFPTHPHYSLSCLDRGRASWLCGNKATFISIGMPVGRDPWRPGGDKALALHSSTKDACEARPFAACRLQRRDTGNYIYNYLASIVWT